MSLRTKISVYNAALTTCGFSKTYDGAGSDEYTVLEANYDEIVRAAFEMQEWPFGRARIALTSRSAGSFGYDDAFTYPEDALHIEEVFLNSYSALDLHEPWETSAQDRKLYVNASERTVEIEYYRSGQEAQWTSTFTRAIILMLQSVLKAAAEEDSEAEALERRAEAMLLRGAVRSSKNRNQRRVWRPGRLRRANQDR